MDISKKDYYEYRVNDDIEMLAKSLEDFKKYVENIKRVDIDTCRNIIAATRDMEINFIHLVEDRAVLNTLIQE